VPKVQFDISSSAVVTVIIAALSAMLYVGGLWADVATLKTDVADIKKDIKILIKKE